MKTLPFLVNETCPEYEDPDPILVPEIQCVAVDEIKAAEAKPGSRTLLVTPYGGSTGEAGICSGQYGQWQVLAGFGGQINRGLYCGDSFEKKEGYSSPGVSSTVDCEDTVYKGTKCIAMRERGRWFVFCPKGSGGGGGGASIAVGVVLGGNVFLKTLPTTDPTLQAPVLRPSFPVPDITENEYGFLDSEYPSRRSFAYTLLDEDPAGNRLEAPIVNDWRKYDLPEGFVLGDKLPRLPDGLCYVRVERPFTMSGGEVWNAADTGAPTRPASGPQAYVKAGLSGASISVWCRYPVDEGLPSGASPTATWVLNSGISGSPSPDTVNAEFTVTEGGSPIVISGRTLGVGAVSLSSEGELVAVLYKFGIGAPIPASSGDLEGRTLLRITVVSGVIVTSDTQTPLGTATLAVATGDIRGAVIVALNDVSRQGFRAGDLVYLIDTVIQYEDRYGLVSEGGNQTRQVYRILGGISGVKRNVTSV